MGGLDEGQMNNQQAAGQKSTNDMVQALMGFGGTPGASSSPSTPAGAPGTAATSSTPSADAQDASDEFSNSFTPQGAKALSGVLQSESGFNPGSQNNAGTDASGVLSNGQGAYGIASWNGSRQADLAKFAKDNAMDPGDADTQKLFVQTEIANNPAYADSYKSLTDPNAKPGDIASTLVSNYENPAARNVGPETSKAMAYAAALRGQNTGISSPGGGISVPGYDGQFTRDQANDADGVPSQAEWDTAQKSAGQVAGPGAPSTPAAASPAPASGAPSGQPDQAATDLQRQAKIQTLQQVMMSPYANPGQQEWAKQQLARMQPSEDTDKIKNYQYGLNHPGFATAQLSADGNKVIPAYQPIRPPCSRALFLLCSLRWMRGA
jgi:Phage tail lysozyme